MYISFDLNFDSICFVWSYIFSLCVFWQSNSKLTFQFKINTLYSKSLHIYSEFGKSTIFLNEILYILGDYSSSCERFIYTKYDLSKDIMTKPESKTEFFYTEKGLIAVDSPVKLQILNLLREEPRSFDEIVKYTAKAKSTISVHLNNLRACELVEENYDLEDRRRKIYSLTSSYMGCSKEPLIKHYKCLLQKVAENGNDRFQFAKTMLHALNFGFEAYGIDNAPVVKIIGCDIGNHLSSIFEAENFEELLIEIARFMEFHGDCRVSVLLKENPSLKIEDNFKGSMPVTGKPFCALREGLIEGILKEKLGKDYKVLETECYGTGHDHCLFNIIL